MFRIRGHPSPGRARPNAGFTLIEVLMSVVIIGILAGVALRSVQSGIESSRIRGTQDEMDELAQAIADNVDLYADGMRSDFGYVGDVGALPSSRDDLVTNPGAYATWNGPYVGRRFVDQLRQRDVSEWHLPSHHSGGPVLRG